VMMLNNNGTIAILTPRPAGKAFYAQEIGV
jgi:hypothetical protein